MASADAILQASATMILAILSLPHILVDLGLPLSRSFLPMIMFPMIMYCGSVILAMLGDQYLTMASGALFALASAVVAVVFAVSFLQVPFSIL